MMMNITHMIMVQILKKEATIMRNMMLWKVRLRHMRQNKVSRNFNFLEQLDPGYNLLQLIDNEQLLQQNQNKKVSCALKQLRGELLNPEATTAIDESER